jgi:methionyl-tRNA formyltransferase
MARIVFMGTPDFAVPTLRALIAHHTVTAVVTQPDRPAGRGGEIQMSPIKRVALEHNIPVLQPEKIRRRANVEELRQHEADAYVVAAFGQILPQEVLDIPPYGSINVHASLLPRWRGAAPIQAAIRAGDDETGVTIMKMDAGLDTGPMLSTGTVPIMPDETGESLHDKLSTLGADLLISTLPGYFSGAIHPHPQPEQGVTFASRIEKEEGRIDWTEYAVVIDRLVRAFTPWPGTFTDWNGKTLKIISGKAVYTGADEPGLVSRDVFDQIAIGTGGGLYFPMMVQLAGKKPTPVEDFVRGYPDFIGSRLGA